MGRGIVKLGDDEYIEWSTIVDAPVSNIVGRERAVAEWGEDRVSRADDKGTSFYDSSEPGPDYAARNRAGPNEECVTLDALRRLYPKGRARR